MTPEQKERGLLVEINNGRAAMLGIMAFVSTASIDGSVPALDGKIAHYAGNVMAPFSAVDTSLPFVAEPPGSALSTPAYQKLVSGKEGYLSISATKGSEPSIEAALTKAMMPSMAAPRSTAPS